MDLRKYELEQIAKNKRIGIVVFLVSVVVLMLMTAVTCRGQFVIKDSLRADSAMLIVKGHDFNMKFFGDRKLPFKYSVFFKFDDKSYKADANVKNNSLTLALSNWDIDNIKGKNINFITVGINEFDKKGNEYYTIINEFKLPDKEKIIIR